MATAKATTGGRYYVSTAANTLAERVPTPSTVSASESTASASYVALTTAGPAVSGLTTGVLALVIVSSTLTSNAAGDNAFASYAVSGATTIAAADGVAAFHATSSSGRQVACSRCTLQTSLTAGSNTFTMQYKSGGAGTVTFQYRHLIVMPF